MGMEVLVVMVKGEVVIVVVLMVIMIVAVATVVVVVTGMFMNRMKTSSPIHKT